VADSAGTFSALARALGFHPWRGICGVGFTVGASDERFSESSILRMRRADRRSNVTLGGADIGDLDPKGSIEDDAVVALSRRQNARYALALTFCDWRSCSGTVVDDNGLQSRSAIAGPIARATLSSPPRQRMGR
jgi:hypothetical protein